MLGEVWDKINFPFPNYNDCSVEVWEYKSDFILHFIIDVVIYPSWV